MLLTILVFQWQGRVSGVETVVTVQLTGVMRAKTGLTTLSTVESSPAVHAPAGILGCPCAGPGCV